MNTELININDVTEPIPAIHSAQIEDAVYRTTDLVNLDPTNPNLDPSKLDAATLKQFRKNVKRLQEKTQFEQMKKVSHFNLGAFFPLGKK
jgi:biotin-(acetyl-CoA carboxylase) ligase